MRFGPKGSKVIGCRWVFRKDSEQYKVRLVVKEYSQKEGIDYNEIFSPADKHTSIRLLLAIVAQGDLELEQLDVKIIFLHGELEERRYMKQPEGSFRNVRKTKCVCSSQCLNSHEWSLHLWQISSGYPPVNISQEEDDEISW